MFTLTLIKEHSPEVHGGHVFSGCEAERRGASKVACCTECSTKEARADLGGGAEGAPMVGYSHTPGRVRYDLLQIDAEVALQTVTAQHWQTALMHCRRTWKASHY